MAYRYQPYPDGDSEEPSGLGGLGSAVNYLPPASPPPPPIAPSAYRDATLNSYPTAPSGSPPQPRFASLSYQQQSYSAPAPPRQHYPVPISRPQPHSVSAPALPQQPYTSSQAPISSYSTPQAYTPYLLNKMPQDYPYINPPSTYTTPQAYPLHPPLSSSQQPLPYPQSYQPLSDNLQASTLGAVPAQTTYSYYDQPYQPAISHRSDTQHAQTTYPAEPTADSAPQPTLLSEPTSGDLLARVSVQDDEDPEAFSSAKALGDYLKIFPEAENGQGCRVFKYGPKCPTHLLMPLFEHFDFPRYSMFHYGFAGDSSIADHWGDGSGDCQKCMDGQLCGQYVLHKNFRFYAYLEVKPSSSTSPKILLSQDAMIISTGESQYSFHRADWNLQFFRFRSQRNQTTVFAYDALVYQNYESETKLNPTPLDYVSTQLDDMFTNWDSVLNASSQFLFSFRVEVLEEHLETDFWQAVYDRHGAFMAKILDGGLSVEYEHCGVRLLQLAIESNNVEVVRLLIEREAAVNVPDMRGTDNKEPMDQQRWTPLDLATFYKHDEFTKLLDPEGKVKEYAWMKTGRIRINASSYLLPRVESSAIPGVAEAP